MDKEKFHLSKPTWGMLIGFVLAILFVWLGFWQTILILILTGLGWLIGRVYQDIPDAIDKIRNLFDRS